MIKKLYKHTKKLINNNVSIGNVVALIFLTLSILFILDKGLTIQGKIDSRHCISSINTRTVNERSERDMDEYFARVDICVLSNKY